MRSGFNLADYETVDSRIDKFWNDFPNGRILTEWMNPGNLDEVMFMASVYTDREDARPAATGFASEKRGGGGANATNHTENGETSSIGRALANLGYKTKKESPRPSQTETGKIERNGPTPKVQAEQEPGRVPNSLNPFFVEMRKHGIYNLIETELGTLDRKMTLRLIAHLAKVPNYQADEFPSVTELNAAIAGVADYAAKRNAKKSEPVIEGQEDNSEPAGQEGAR